MTDLIKSRDGVTRRNVDVLGGAEGPMAAYVEVLGQPSATAKKINSTGTSGRIQLGATVSRVRIATPFRLSQPTR